MTLILHDTKNLTQNIELNEKVKTIKLLEENTIEIWLGICIGNNKHKL